MSCSRFITLSVLAACCLAFRSSEVLALPSASGSVLLKNLKLRFRKTNGKDFSWPTFRDHLEAALGGVRKHRQLAGY